RNIMTFELAIITDFGIIRYGEIGHRLPGNIMAGKPVSKGQPIGWVATQHRGTMLHLEWFNDPNRLDALTQMGNKQYLHVPNGNYNRRSDLADPTDFLANLPLREDFPSSELYPYR